MANQKKNHVLNVLKVLLMGLLVFCGTVAIGLWVANADISSPYPQNILKSIQYNPIMQGAIFAGFIFSMATMMISVVAVVDKSQS